MRRWSLGIGLVILGVAAEPTRLTAQVSGEAIFQQNCSACHSTGNDRLVGPGLAGVTTRRDSAWLKRFIMRPDQVLASGDSIATALLQEYQVPMPNLGTTDAEAEALIAFLRGAEAAGGGESGTPRAAVIATVLVFAGLTWGTVGLTVGLFEARAEAARRNDAERKALEERDRARRAVSVALSVILDGLRSSEAEISPAILDDIYWALTQTFGEPASGKEEALRHIVQFAVAARLLSHGRAAEAEDGLVRLKAWVDQQFGSVNAAAVMVRELLAEAQIELEKYTEAEPVALEAYRGYLELYGPEASRTRKSLRRLVDLYGAWGKPQMAAEWQAKFERRKAEN